MANHDSAAKANRQAIRRNLRNRSARSAVRSQLRGAVAAVASGDLEAAEAGVKQAVSAMDRAAKNKVVHPNNAARHKSRLMKKLNSAKAASA